MQMQGWHFDCPSAVAHEGTVASLCHVAVLPACSTSLLVCERKLFTAQPLTACWARHRVRSVASLLQPITSCLICCVGYTVRKDTFISASVWTMHHDERVWHHPYDFIPERWIDGTPEASGRPSNAWQPFGEGPRRCPAYRFALEEAKIALIRTYQKFGFKLSPGQVPLKLQHTITLAPKGGLHVTPVFRYLAGQQQTA